MTRLHLAFRLPHGPRGIEIDLTLPAAGLTAIFGPSGAGKSSMLRALTGLDPAAVDVHLTAAGAALRARLTRRSVEGLGLAPGAPCHAIVKSVALARD